MIRDRAARPAGGGETVLVVEDEPALRRLITIILRHSGYRVLEAEGGDQALLAAEAEPGIALVLCDAVMPRGGGGWTVERLRALRPGLRVVFMSGYAADQLPELKKIAPDARLILKPMMPDALLAIVRDVLRTPALT